jgi:hypothetical protein
MSNPIMPPWPVHLRLRDSGPFAFAGLWEICQREVKPVDEYAHGDLDYAPEGGESRINRLLLQVVGLKRTARRNLRSRADGAL